MTEPTHSRPTGLDADTDTRRAPSDVEAVFRSAFDHSPLAAAILADLDEPYHSVNDALCALLGRSQDDLLETPAHRTIHPDDHAALREAMRTPPAATDRHERVGVRLRHASGMLVDATITLSRLPDEESRPRFLYQIEGITDRRAAEPMHQSRRGPGDRVGSLLSHAVEEDRLVVHYQPIVHIEDARVVGFEALVRLVDEANNLIPPGEFIPIAEESGRISAIGAWVLATACRHAVVMSRYCGRPLTIAVNVSARQVADTDLAETVADVLQRTGLPAGALTLELTESALLDADDAVVARLHAVRSTGARIGLDDFGTGYSSLTYLHQLPITQVKIDRSFVAGVTSSSADAAIVRAVTRLAGEINLEWVAEGIETQDQWDALRALGPGYGQGFLFSRPVPVDAATALARSGLPARLFPTASDPGASDPGASDPGASDPGASDPGASSR